MELFSNDQSQLSLMDCVYLSDSPPCNPLNTQRNHEELSKEFCIPSYYYWQESIPVSSASSLTETFSSSKVELEDSQWKKRKQTNVNCLTTAQSKESKRKRKKKSSSEKKVMEEKQPPTDYIHVRARRGQATDSHSLAERVRRERISERMKILQDLVPGCEKVTGMVLTLDEIINYVESLKNQVEFLSMKLASVNPILLEFGLNFDDFTSTTQNLDCHPQLQSPMVQSSHIRSPGDNITVMPSSSTAVLYGKGPSLFPQDAESYFMQAGDQTEALDHQFDLCSMCSFQQK